MRRAITTIIIAAIAILQSSCQQGQEHPHGKVYVKGVTDTKHITNPTIEAGGEIDFAPKKNHHGT